MKSTSIVLKFLRGTFFAMATRNIKFRTNQNHCETTTKYNEIQKHSFTDIL